ncbi:flagellar hook-length control protein FliK [Echinimonas agarilytica]|uniref:Flagellar hook-length control protein FliK n=1 Tax=Echinimonas agarilytica TaxID=1215918 RepID=A0AA41W4T4_9GAMM|nr:flagellar hook-length control protein FliK [Echinimonas agarilytica]MCM2678972.1 flagellar hook-length control protein FliK [Echinimonas agarilytica]
MLPISSLNGSADASSAYRDASSENGDGGLFASLFNELDLSESEADGIVQMLQGEQAEQLDLSGLSPSESVNQLLNWLKQQQEQGNQLPLDAETMARAEDILGLIAEYDNEAPVISDETELAQDETQVEAKEEDSNRTAPSFIAKDNDTESMRQALASLIQQLKLSEAEAKAQKEDTVTDAESGRSFKESQSDQAKASSVWNDLQMTSAELKSQTNSIGGVEIGDAQNMLSDIPSKMALNTDGQIDENLLEQEELLPSAPKKASEILSPPTAKHDPLQQMFQRELAQLQPNDMAPVDEAVIEDELQIQSKVNGQQPVSERALADLKPIAVTAVESKASGQIDQQSTDDSSKPNMLTNKAESTQGEPGTSDQELAQNTAGKFNVKIGSSKEESQLAFSEKLAKEQLNIAQTRDSQTHSVSPTRAPVEGQAVPSESNPAALVINGKTETQLKTDLKQAEATKINDDAEQFDADLAADDGLADDAEQRQQPRHSAGNIFASVATGQTAPDSSISTGQFSTSISQAQQAVVNVAAAPQSMAAELAIVEEKMQLLQDKLAPILGQRLMMMMDKNIQTADIQLDPPELGSLMVRVQVQNDQAQVSFVAQNAQAKDAIEQAMPRLKEMLQQQEMELVNANVSYQQGDRGGRDQQQQGSHAQNSQQQVEQDIAQVSQPQQIMLKAGHVDFYA